MAEVADLWVKLSLLSTGFSDGIKVASAEAEGFTAKTSNIGEGLAKIAKAGVAAGVGIAAISVRMAGDWQASMIKLTTSAGEAGTVVNGKLTGPIAQVSDGLLKMAVQTGTSTKELASGMYFVESAGFHGAAGLQVMKAAAEGARAEGASLSTVTDALTTALHDMGMGANQSIPMMNMMVRAVGDGKMTMEAFAGSLHSVLPQAHAAGIEFPDVAAAIATMTVAGTSADQATQMLGHTIQSLQNPNAQAVKWMSQMGISATDLTQNLGERGLLGTISMVDQAILQHMGKDGLELQSAFNQSKSAAQDLNIMLSQMPANLRKLAEAVENGTMSAKDFNKVTGDMPANLKAQASEFLTLYKNATSFNSALRGGTPDAMTFAGMLRKVLGDTVDANTALQIGGTNLSYYAQTAKDVAAAGKNAGDNIETWSTIQAGFNFRIDQAKEAIQTTAIRIGTSLLPRMMGLFDLVTSRGGPILHQLETDFRNALDSPAVHQAESTIAEFWHNFVAFLGDARTAVANLRTVVQPIASDIGVSLFGALKVVGDVLKNVVGPALVLVSGFFQTNSGMIHTLADVALAALIAKLIYTKSLLAIDMFTTFVKGIGTAVVGLVNFGTQVGNGKIFDTIRLKAMYAGDAMRGLAATEGEAGAAAAAASGAAGVGGFASKLGTLVGTGALVGGVVLGLGMVANWISHIGQKSVDTAAEMNQMTSQLLDIAKSGSAANTQLAALAVQGTRLGTSFGNDFFKPIDDALAQMVQSGNLKQAQVAIQSIDDQLRAAGLSTDKFHNALTKFTDAAGLYVNQQREAATATQDSTSATDSSTSALNGNTSALGLNTNNLGDSTSATDALANSTSNLMQQQQDMSKGLNADRALDDYNRAVKNLTQSMHDNGTALTGDSDAAMNNRDALRQTVQSIIDNYNAQIQLTGDTDAANKKLHDQISALENQKGMSQQTKDAIKAYIDQLNLIPPNVTTNVTANTGEAVAKVTALQNKLNFLANSDSGGGSGSSKSAPPAPSGGGGGHKLPTYDLGGYVNAPKGQPQLAVVHGGEYILSNDMLDNPGGGSGGGFNAVGGGTVVNNYITVQGSILAERDLRDVVETQMLQLGGRRPTTYAAYSR